jgi:MraZ protein
VAVEHLFRGNALNAVDAKGRVSVPAFIRQKIERRSDEKAIVLARHEAFPCLVGYDTRYAEIVAEENERKRLKEEDSDPLAHYSRAYLTMGDTGEVPYDGSGRIVLPPRIRRKAAIEDLALFVGVGGTFEIWNPRVAVEQGPAPLAELAADWLEEKGAAS